MAGWGRVRHVKSVVWFDPPHPVALAYTGRPAPMSRYAMRLDGADPDAVATDLPADGSVPGWATITGVWYDDGIQVQTQSPVPPAPPARRWPSLTRPPCPPPAGGWPTGGTGKHLVNLDVDPGDLLATGAAVTLAQFQAGPDQLVLVVAATDKDAVERWLRPQLGPRLCVVPSRWTRDQVDAVLAVVRDKWRVDDRDVPHGADDDAYVEVHPFRVPADMAAWAAGVPDDLLHVTPALAPARRRPPPSEHDHPLRATSGMVVHQRD